MKTNTRWWRSTTSARWASSFRKAGRIPGNVRPAEAGRYVCMPPRFPPQTLEAVGACTRAMDGPANAEAILARVEAATIGGLRAAGDRLALRRRWHDDRVERRVRPEESPAREIFDALELARLDAIGARSLAGVAPNLVAHPGADRDGLRWVRAEE